MRSLPQARFQGALENNFGFRQRDDGSPFPLALARERTRIRRNYQFFFRLMFSPKIFSCADSFYTQKFFAFSFLSDASPSFRERI